MCTLIVLHRPHHPWPLLLAANRDEMLDRPWLAPGRHWEDQPDIVGGRDRLAGGTWLAVNDAGVIAGVLNRANSLGPEQGRRSRGELPLLALRHRTAATAAAAIAALDGAAYRSFNLVLADAESAFFLRGEGVARICATALAAGLHMVTASDPDDPSHPRIARHRPRFAQAPPPSPPDWAAWPSLLGDASGPPQAALTVPPINGFGTASATLLALGASGQRHLLFAAGRPDEVAFHPVSLLPS